MSEMTLFQNNPLASSDLFKSLQDMNKNISGGGSGSATKKISIRGGRFRLMEGKQQVSVSKDSDLNVVIVNAAKVSRTYYEGAYDPEKVAAPTCWSADTQTPASDVPDDQRQASRCADCKMNIKGSGQGNSRACRFAQRLAITLEGKPSEVYQMQLPATSIFGEAKGNDMGLQAYGRLLDAHGMPIAAVITKMRFDENSETPKLFFTPVRPLDEAELRTAIEAKNSPASERAVSMSMSKAAPKALAYSPAPVADVKIEEPKKVVMKPAVEVKTDKSLDDIVGGWDDE
jgi:hypothetical protein